MEGRGTIRIKNRSGAALQRLRFAWEGAQAGLLEIRAGGTILGIHGAEGELRQADLPAPLAAGEETEIGIRFQRAVKLPDADSALRLANWHPRLYWGYETQASFDVGIDAPEGFQVAASGWREPGTGRYKGEGIRSFGLWLGSGHQELETTAGKTVVRVLFLPSMRSCAQTLASYAVDAIQFYRKRFGMYPQPSLTIVPGEPAPTSGGYPIATSMVMIHGMEAFDASPATHWRWIVAHEIGHQYWLEHVMAKESEASWGWLMVGLGIWMDREYSQERGMGELHPARLESYANTMRNGMDTTVQMPPARIGQLRYDYNSQVTHNKAYGIISALAAMLGPETFERVHSRCLREHGGARMGAAEFRRVAEVESAQDLGWFFTPWLQTNGYASYEVTATENAVEGGTRVARVRIRQIGEIAMPIPVEARFEDGSSARSWTDRFRKEQTLEWYGKPALREVVLDPDREFPLIWPPPSPEYQAVASRVVELPWAGAGNEAAALYDAVLKLKVEDPDILFKLGLQLYDGRYYEQALELCRRTAAAAKDTNRPRHFQAVAWQGILLDQLGRRAEAVENYRQALTLAGDMRSQHTQYKLVIDRAFLEQRLTDPYVRQ
jgi:hypothetical protein